MLIHSAMHHSVHMHRTSFTLTYSGNQPQANIQGWKQVFASSGSKIGGNRKWVGLRDKPWYSIWEQSPTKTEALLLTAWCKHLMQTYIPLYGHLKQCCMSELGVGPHGPSCLVLSLPTSNFWLETFNTAGLSLYRNNNCAAKTLIHRLKWCGNLGSLLKVRDNWTNQSFVD